MTLGAIGFGGNTLWLLYIGWLSVRDNWWNLLNPLLDIVVVFRWLFSWPFWILLLITAAGYGLIQAAGGGQGD